MPPDPYSLALDEARDGVPRVALGARAVLLRSFARVCAPELIAAIGAIAAISPFRHMVTPGGLAMSVALTNCGQIGWVTDRTGYRYDAIDPETGRPWPAMPRIFADLADLMPSITFVCDREKSNVWRKFSQRHCTPLQKYVP